MKRNARLKHTFNVGDVAIQINAPLEDRFVRITDITWQSIGIGHQHFKSKQTGVVRKQYLRKCSKQEELELKVIHAL